MNKKLQGILAVVGLIIAGAALYAPIRYFSERQTSSSVRETASVSDSIPNISALENMTTSQLFSTLISAGLLTAQRRDDFLASLTFDHVFNTMSSDQVLSALIANNLVSDSSVAALKSHINSDGIDISHLRGAGIIQALIGFEGGHFHEILPGSVQNASGVLQASFAANKTAFLDFLSRNYVLFMLDGERRTSSDDPAKTVYAYLPGVSTQEYSNIIGVPLGKFVEDQSLTTVASSIAGQPAGHKAFMIWNYIEKLASTTLDIQSRFDITDPNGAVHEYIDIWMDQWTAATQSKLTTYFSGLKALNVPLDLIAVDLEDGFVTYDSLKFSCNRIYSTSDDCVTTSPGGNTVWKEIYSDPRWPAVAARIGIAPDEIKHAASWDDTMIRRFNAVMAAREGEYLKSAFIDAFAPYYPDAKFISYSDGNYSNQTMPYDYAANFIWQYGEGVSEIPASERDRWMSAAFGGYSWPEPQSYYPSTVIAPNDPPQPMPSGLLAGSPTAFRTPFQGLSWDMTWYRQHVTTTDAPASGWVAFPGYRNGAYGPDSGTGVQDFGDTWIPASDQNDDLYGERIFHSILSGSKDLMYWYNDKHTDTDDPTLNNYLKEVTEMAGYETSYPITFTPELETDNYLLTGMEAGGKYIYRFTPRLGDSSLSNPSFSPSDVLISESPATFRLIDGTTFTIPNSHVVHPSTEYSPEGFWVVQDYQEYLTTDLASAVTALDALLGGTTGGGGGGGGDSHSIGLSFTVTPTKDLNYGDQVTFSWNATKADSCTASDGWVGTFLPKGSLTVPVYDSRAYTLKCINQYGSKSKTLSLDVGAPAVGGDNGGEGTITTPDDTATSSLHVKAVGADYTVGTAPAGLIFSLDNQVLPAGSLVGVSDIPVGAHTLSVADDPAYTESYGTCTYPNGGQECFVPETGFGQTLTCADGVCSAPVTITQGVTTKIAVRYTYGASTDLISGSGAIKIKHVGANEYASSAPLVVSATIDSGAATAQNPALFQSITAGDHTVSALKLSGYNELYGICQYAGTAECVVSTFSSIQCDAASCSVSAPVSSGKTTKVVFKYISLNPVVPAPPKATPPAPPKAVPPPVTPKPTPAPVVPPPPAAPSGFSVSCLPFPSTISPGDSVVWKAYPSPAGTYTYTWSGDDGLGGSGVTISKIYIKPGTKTATVTVNGVSRQCNKTVTVNDY